MTTKPLNLRRGLTWVLAGATFLAVLGSAGCAATCPALRGTGAGGENAEAARPVDAGPWADEVREVRGPATGGVVNVFGEFGGARRGGPVRQVGEAGFQQHTAVDEGEDSGVAVDPTGRWMIYTSTRHSEHADIYVQRVDGTSVTQLTNDAADDAFPVFSPDGKRIAFCSTRSGTWQVYVMDADGRNAMQVTSGRTQCIHPTFSPDGTRIAYS